MKEFLHKGFETDFSDKAWSLQYWPGYKPMLIYNVAGTRHQITASAALELNKRHHIASAWGFYPGDTAGKSWFRFYINGMQQNEIDVTTFLPLKNSAGDLIIRSQLPESHSPA